MYADACFLLDIIINFFSAFYDEENKLISNNRVIARKYLSGWFAIDLIAGLPFSIVFS